MARFRSILVRSGAVLGFTCLALAVAIRYRPVRAASSDSPTTRRISVSGSGSEACGPSSYPALSADGRFAAFASTASNLVAGDSNDSGDIFVKDSMSGALVCTSVSGAGTPAAGGSFAPSISADGQRVVFVSEAANLVSGDTNGEADVFLRDLATETTTRISVSTSGQEADGASSAPRISGDGRFVAFASQATNLVPGDTNEESDVFVRDLQTGATERISQSSTGGPADGPSESASISADGRYVAFASSALNLIAGESGEGASRVWDVYLRDRANGTIVRVSRSTTGGNGNGHSFVPVLSGDGLRVAFTSEASNLIPSDLNGCADVFLRDLLSGTTVRVSAGLGGAEPSGASARPSISADGRFVAFESSATNLVSVPAPEHSTWTYLRDLQTGLTTRVVAAAPEARPGGGALRPAISADGHWIAFSSSEPDLVGGDGNDLEDVFLRGPLP